MLNFISFNFALLSGLFKRWISFLGLDFGLIALKILHFCGFLYYKAKTMFEKFKEKIASKLSPVRQLPITANKSKTIVTKLELALNCFQDQNF